MGYDECTPEMSKPMNKKYSNIINPVKNVKVITMENNARVTKSYIDASLRESDKKSSSPFMSQELIWQNIIAITLFHMMAVYSYLTFPYLQRPLTVLWSESITYLCILYSPQ